MTQTNVLHCNHYTIVKLEKTTLNDRDLVAHYLKGDKAAIDLMDDWIGAAVRPYRSRLSLWWEDVQQDIRLKMYELFRKDGFRGEKGLKTYVWKVVNHTCIDYLRKHSQKRLRPLDEIDASLHLVAKNVPELKTSATQLGLVEILAKVPRECRHLWQMILSGLGYPQMSRQLEISEATLRVRVYRCRKKAVALRKKVSA